MVDKAAELYHAVCVNNADKILELLDSGANPNEYYDDMENISSSSILHVCCGKGHLESIRVLVDRGADIMSRDKWRMSPLIHAITPQFTEVVEFLVTRCPDVVNMCDKFGKAPLHYAIESDCVAMVNLLICYGADVNIGTMKGITPLMLLCSKSDVHNDTEMIRLLINHGALVNLRDLAAKRSALQVYTVLMAYANRRSFFINYTGLVGLSVVIVYRLSVVLVYNGLHRGGWVVSKLPTRYIYFKISNMTFRT